LIEKNDLDKDNRLSYDEFLIGAQKDRERI